MRCKDDGNERREVYKRSSRLGRPSSVIGRKKRGGGGRRAAAFSHYIPIVLCVRPSHANEAWHLFRRTTYPVKAFQDARAEEVAAGRGGQANSRRFLFSLCASMVYDDSDMIAISHTLSRQTMKRNSGATDCAKNDCSTDRQIACTG